MGGVALIGLKHSGKTSLVHPLASFFGVPAFDLDNCILRVHTSGESIRQLYEIHGKAWFQRAELTAMRQLPHTDIFLATGGGSMENTRLMDGLKQRDMVFVFLDVPEAVLFGRILQNGLPPFLKGDNPAGIFHQFYIHRRGYALDRADIHIVAGDLPENELLDIVKMQLSMRSFQWGDNNGRK